MKWASYYVTLALLVAPLAVTAQYSSTSSSTSTDPIAPMLSSDGGGAGGKTPGKAVSTMGPFSEFALGGGVGTMGVNLELATNLSRNLNIRGTGNLFKYNINNISTDGFNLAGQVNFGTGGVSLDYYPWASHGFRLSPGVIFYNTNQITASATGAAGSDLKLAGTVYYTDTGTSSPMAMNAILGLNHYKQAFTMTTGWGNMIPRNGGHFSVPFEIGAAVTGTPTINVALSGYGCTNQEDASDNGESCINMATNSSAQASLNSQLSTWETDLNKLKVYPILTIGIAFSFNVR
jgi:hypothetical protein